MNEDDRDDDDLFRRAMRDAKPIRRESRAPAGGRKPAPVARFRRRDEKDVLRESLEADIDELETGAGDILRFHRPSIGRRTMRRLARGNFSVQGEIDLHGMTAEEARNELRSFISASLDRGHRCVRIVHGKGLGSGQRGPVLKGLVNRDLRRWREVLAFVSTRQVHGGTGAVYVLLDRD